MTAQSFKELVVWQRSMGLVKEVYMITNRLPKNEQYGIVSQMRRSAVSIPSNIAEGKKRGTKKDFTQFLRIADGSAAELETQMIIAADLYNINTTYAAKLLEEVQKMITTMIKKMHPTSSKL